MTHKTSVIYGQRKNVLLLKNNYKYSEFTVMKVGQY